MTDYEEKLLDVLCDIRSILLNMLLHMRIDGAVSTNQITYENYSELSKDIIDGAYKRLEQEVNGND